jgi:hypothetical protein|tara:strand:+ start:235 stop:399 length:165 start_codon:yes stop_codon:yes gene_type:complete
MSFDPDNPTAIIKDGLIFAAVSKVFQIVTDKAADFVDNMPDNENDFYEDYRDQD